MFWLCVKLHRFIFRFERFLDGLLDLLDEFDDRIYCRYIDPYYVKMLNAPKEGDDLCEQKR